MALSARQRQQVYERAAGCCEYCRRSIDVRLASFEIDHIVSLKYGGDESSDNLCLSCAPCNRHKGPEIAAIDPLTDEAAKLFHPRQQNWGDHFQINSDASLAGTTPEGRAAVAVLRINEAPRVEQRYGEILLARLPLCYARRWGRSGELRGQSRYNRVRAEEADHDTRASARCIRGDH